MDDKNIELKEVVDKKKRAECNGISRNGCFYSSEEILQTLNNSKYVQESNAQGLWGELEHPV